VVQERSALLVEHFLALRHNHPAISLLGKGNGGT